MQLESARWALVAGLMLGGAIAANPAGVWFSLAGTAAWLYTAWSRPQSRRDLGHAAKLLIPSTVVTALPWFVAAPTGFDAEAAQSLHSVLSHLGPQAFMALGGLLIARRLRQ